MKKSISYIVYGCILPLILFLSFACNAQNADIDLLRDINHSRSASGDKVMEGFSNSVYVVSGILPVATLITGYAAHDKKIIANGWQIAAGLGVDAILTFGIKDAVGRKRPYITYPDIDPYQHVTDASFPSGHTSFSFYSAASVSMCYPKWYVIAPSYLWAATAGYSRMYLGMHYPTDVLAGAVVGTGSAWLAYKGNRWLQKRRHSKSAVPKE